VDGSVQRYKRVTRIQPSVAGQNSVLPRRILFPIDFSERCLGAARHVEAMTTKLDCEVFLVHVVERSVSEEAHQNKLAVRRFELGSFLRKELGSYRVKRVLLEGDTVAAIVQLADHEKIDLIMMPTHGWSGDQRSILGSVTANVLQQAHCAVWTGLRMEIAPLRKDINCQHIVCAVAPRPGNENVEAWAAAIAHCFGAQMTMVRCDSGAACETDACGNADLVVIGRTTPDTHAIIQCAQCPVVYV
jgi:nucleotide-binding universal stress UspA family protein